MASSADASEDETTGLLSTSNHRSHGLRQSHPGPYTRSGENPTSSPHLTDPRADRVRQRRGGRTVSASERIPGGSDHDPVECDLGFEWLSPPENPVEAQRMTNNYMFGFRKWKSHVTQRPLSERSEIIKALYADTEQIPADRGTCTVGNIVYVVLFGWWMSLFYCLIGVLMAISLLGFPYCKFSFRIALYMLWPFGKFVHKSLPVQPMYRSTAVESQQLSEAGSFCQDGYASLDGEHDNKTRHKFDWENVWHHKATAYWRRPSTYVWLALACPLLFILHVVGFFLSWFFVFTIPVSKINQKTLRKVLLLPPELLRIEDSSLSNESGDIIMYTHDAINIYYYKYTVDGVNVICVNLLIFVLFALGVGYLDKDDQVTTKNTKFVLSLISIIPLSYYIGMAITSISAQTNFAIGAVLNATFGSVVEIILYITALINGQKSDICYVDLVKAGLVGTLLATTMLIPGLSMVVGGLKHSSQLFNPRAAGITATLLFVSVAGVFAPSIFSRAYGSMICSRCSKVHTNLTLPNDTFELDCEQCHYTMTGNHAGQKEFYADHIRPLVYCCAVILPLSYIIGLIYSLKTHRAVVYDTFASEAGTDDGHHSVHWGRIKSLVILLIAVTLMSLCADLVTVNIEPLLTEANISVNFFGVTMLALIPDIPEIVIGVQFAMQNNISLSFEVGNCIAVQVCMVQVPLLILANIIKPLGFYLVFSDIHIWSVIIGVLINNYVFQDGKCNYFQGSALILSYLALIMMYFFSPNVSC